MGPDPTVAGANPVAPTIDRCLKAAEWTLAHGNGLAWLDPDLIEEYHRLFAPGFESNEERCIALCFMAAVIDSGEK